MPIVKEVSIDHTVTLDNRRSVAHLDHGKSADLLRNIDTSGEKQRWWSPQISTVELTVNDLYS